MANRINWEVRQFQALVAIAEEGSFSAAAKRVFMSQPALSLLIKQMEQRLELKLFHRTTRKVETTPAGQELLVTARRVIAEVEEALAQLRDYADCRHGRVAVAALPSLASTFLAEAVSGFRKQFPGVRVAVIDGVASTVVESLNAGEVDMALGLEMQPGNELSVSHLLTDELVAIAHPSQFPINQTSLTWTELARHPIVAMARGTSIRRLADQAFGRVGIDPEPAYEVSFMTTAIALVENREGVTVLPSSALPALLPPHLIRLALESPRVERQICILERRGRHRSPAAENMIEHLKRVAANWSPTNRL